MKVQWLIVCVFTAAIFMGCATTDILGGFNLISPQEEVQLGNELAQNIAKQKVVVTDPEITNYISSVGRKLVSVSMNPEAVYEFHVIAEPDVNAFAIPGGHLYVQTGLIGAAENEAELAAVIGHELGHAEKRHPTQQMSRVMGTEMIMSVLLGKDPSATQQLATLATSIGISSYSRSAENEADSIGTYLLNRAGYDPNAMVTFFSKLQKMEQQAGGGSGSSMLASHPPTQDRITAVQNLITSFGSERSKGVNLVGDFKQLQNRVKSLGGQQKIK